MTSESSGSAGFYEFLGWLEQNKKQLGMAFGAAVVIGFGISAYRWKTHQTELAANYALLQLRTPLGAADKTPPPSAAAYAKIVSDFAGTDAAERAGLLAAGAAFTEGKYAEAQAQFTAFLEKHVRHPLAAAAAYGKAASLEAQGKIDEALAAYQGLLTQYANSAALDEAKLSIGRIYELKNQPGSALKTYEDISRPNAPSAHGAEAMRRKEALLARYPDLAKTNAPPSPTPGAASTSASTNASPATGAKATAAKTNAAPAKP